MPWIARSGTKRKLTTGYECAGFEDLRLVKREWDLVKRAIISDIHGNFEALTVVMADIAARGVESIFCLGDIIGYGPNPVDCLDTVRKKCQRTILGNHDQAALFDPDGFNPLALQAIYWTRAQIENGSGSDDDFDQRWGFLGDLPPRFLDGEYLFVHGSPREPTNEYVFPEDSYDDRKMTALFGRIERYCFQGHTHIPGIFFEDRTFMSPEEADQTDSDDTRLGRPRTYTIRLPDSRAMINVGSVGQPRDGNPRSCYVILDTDERTVTYVRLEYDVQKTRQKIYAIEDLDNMLGDRLLTGR